MDGRQAEITLRGRIHVVTGRHAVEDVGLEHGIETHAAELHTMVREHVRVIFQMVAKLRRPFRFQQRLQRLEHRLPRQLIRRAGVVMPNRNIGCKTGLDAKRQADNLRLHVIEAGGFGIKRDQLGRFQLVDPRGELRFGADHLVVLFDRRRWRDRC